MYQNKGFSIQWTNYPNAYGVKPPHPQFSYDPLPSNITPITSMPDPTDPTQIMPIGLIQSKREPYAVEYAYSKYGGLNTKLGVNWGS